MKLRLSLAALALAGLFAAGCDEQKPAAQAGAIPSLVNISKLQAATHEAFYEYPATLISDRDVTLLSKASGEVTQIFAHDGERVKKDQIIVQIDNEMALAQLQAANADLAAANAEFFKAEKEYQRTMALKASSSAKQIDAATASYKRAQAAVLKAQAALKIAKINEEHTRVLAPFSGTLGRVMINEGDFIAASSSKIVRISDSEKFKAEFYLPDSDRAKLGGIKAGQPASFVYEGKTYRGEIGFIDANNELAAARAYASFSAAGAEVPLESFVKLRIENIMQPGVYRVEKANLLQDVNGYYVYLRRGGKAAQVHVKVVFENEEFALIKAAGSGINDGEELILDNYKKIHPGSAVATDAEFAAMMKAAAAAKASGAQKAPGGQSAVTGQKSSENSAQAPGGQSAVTGQKSSLQSSAQTAEQAAKKAE